MHVGVVIYLARVIKAFYIHTMPSRMFRAPPSVEALAFTKNHDHRTVHRCAQSSSHDRGPETPFSDIQPSRILCNLAYAFEIGLKRFVPRDILVCYEGRVSLRQNP